MDPLGEKGRDVCTCRPWEKLGFPFLPRIKVQQASQRHQGKHPKHQTSLGEWRWTASGRRQRWGLEELLVLTTGSVGSREPVSYALNKKYRKVIWRIQQTHCSTQAADGYWLQQRSSFPQGQGRTAESGAQGQVAGRYRICGHVGPQPPVIWHLKGKTAEKGVWA